MIPTSSELEGAYLELLAVESLGVLAIHLIENPTLAAQEKRGARKWRLEFAGIKKSHIDIKAVTKPPYVTSTTREHSIEWPGAERMIIEFGIGTVEVVAMQVTDLLLEEIPVVGGGIS